MHPLNEGSVLLKPLGSYNLAFTGESPPVGDNQAARLESLDKYDILDTPREEAFDRVTRLVRHSLAVPMATVTFLDGHRQWHKSRDGVDATEGARNLALCRIPIAESRLLVVPDTHDDPRFRNNPLITGDPWLRFYAGAPLRGANGYCIGTLCAMDTRPRMFSSKEIEILLDLARIVEAELELRLLATTDSLTGVVSRRAFLKEGERAVGLAQRHRHDLSCIVLDLDHFKTINDTLGHAAGDSILATTTQTCAALLRQSDIFGRLGGEEFAILLPYANVADAAAVAEKLRAGVEAQAKHANRVLPPVTASFGIAGLGSPSGDLASLIAAADEAMYQAKSRGRNGCVVSAPRPAEGAAAAARRVLKAGQISFNFGGSVIDCTVRRLSNNGAQLEVLSSAQVPKQFKLSIEADGFSKSCKVSKKDQRRVEVVFE